MGSTQFGNFQNFCRDSTLPICNILIPRGEANQPPGQAYLGIDACVLQGIGLGGNRNLANLGAILVDGLAILTTLFLLWRSERKRAAVGRREMQLFLLGFLIISICDIFTVGGFPLNDNVRRGFTAAHLAAIAATFWILMCNGLVGYQLIDDGTPLSILLVLGSAAAVFVGTGYVALDTGFNFTGYFADESYGPTHRNIALYVLYQLLPLICIFIFFILEAILVLRVLQEKRPMIWLFGAGLLFGIGQVFQYVISIHICRPLDGKIDGNFFQALFNLLSVVMIWIFWSSITEDDWPVA
ncbi:hypothetical protein LTR64_004720 [Lithohypha guttulata]|uniref:uncharacterized protein n=1 Tax=Lithohypha guttulata TaxID=1690604 RepID=UPI002DDF0274|nr:hypothetical protein LTR51_005982 [Lithohypha guttulata]